MRRIVDGHYEAARVRLLASSAGVSQNDCMETQTGWLETEVDGVVCRYHQPKNATIGVVFLPPLDGGGPELVSAVIAACKRESMLVVAPQVSGCWWPRESSSGVSTQWLRGHLLPWIHLQFGVPLGQIALLGDEAGGQAALRVSYWYPSEFPVVAAIAPTVDFQLCLAGEAPTRTHERTLREFYPDAESARQDTATLHIHPLNWPRHQWFACDPLDIWWEGCERLRMKLFSLGVPHVGDLETTSDTPAAYRAAQLPQALTFIAERIAAEQRRL